MIVRLHVDRRHRARDMPQKRVDVRPQGLRRLGHGLLSSTDDDGNVESIFTKSAPAHGASAPRAPKSLAPAAFLSRRNLPSGVDAEVAGALDGLRAVGDVQLCVDAPDLPF